MAKNKVGIEIKVDTTDSDKSVKSLKQQLKEAQQNVQELSDKFGATSKEAVEAAKKAAELKDAIGDAKALTDAYNPDAKFKAFGAAIQGVAGGFAALQGAQALFGAESEDLQKTLVKVQSALALSQGLDALSEAKDSFRTLGKQAIETFNKIKGAIGSSGIGLLVIALGTVYAYWDDIKGAVSGVSEEQKKLLETQKKSVTASERNLDIISRSENILKLQGKTEKQILNLKISATKITINELDALLTTQKTMREVQIDTAKRNKDILEGILHFISFPLTAITTTFDAIGKLAGKDFGLKEKVFGSIAKMVFDPKEVKTEADKTIEETQNKLTDLKNAQAGYQLEIQKINEDAAKKSVDDKKKHDTEAEALRKKQEEEEKKRLENLLAQNKHTDELIQANRLSAIKDGFTRRQMELATQEQKEIDDEIDKLNKKEINQEQYQINRNNIIAKYALLQTQLIIDNNNKLLQIEKETFDLQTQARLGALKEGYLKQQEIEAIRYQSEIDKQIELLNTKEINQIEYNKRREAIDAIHTQNLTKIQFDAAEEQRKIDEDLANAKQNIRNAELSAVDAGISILKGLGEKNKDIQKIALIAENAVAIARTVIAANQSVLETKAKANAIPAFVGPGIPNPSYIAAQVIATKNILATKINAATSIASIIAATAKGLSALGGGSAGGGGGNITGGGGGTQANAPLTPQISTTNINQGQVNQLASATARAFVLESDVSGSQERIRRINRAARIN